MSETLKWQLFFVLIVVLIAGYFAYPLEDKWGFRQGEWFEGRKVQPGLDLQGGAEIRVQLQKAGLDPAKVRESTDRAKDTIEKRINLFGLKEPRIQRYGEDQILIQLPGMDAAEIERVKRVITTTGRLDFKLEADKAIVKDYAERYPQAPSGYNWYENQDRPDRTDRVLVKDKVEMTGEHLIEAGTHLGQSGVVVSFKLSLKGKKVFSDITSKFAASVVGEEDARRLAILLDNKLVSAPIIREPITGGEGIIEGNFTSQTAQDLATVLRSGSLPASLEIIEDSFVGPSLGEDAIKRGIISFGLAMIAVALFMMLYYHAAGLIAVVALAMNFTLIWGILTFFNATMTLPGIAALILTMGMAVDSNILFYERIREEREKGHDAKTSFEAGFNRALITVVDANLTTLLAGLILFYFGTGPLKGFAIVLSVGILTTLFTGYFATKVIMQLSIESGILKKVTMFKIFNNPQIKFMSIAKFTLPISVILVISSVVLFLAKGRDSYGIDFTGGTVLNIKFRGPEDISYVRSTIQAITATDSAGAVKAKYSDVEIQSMMERLAKDKKVTRITMGDIFAQSQTNCDEFQVRTRFVTTAPGVIELKRDLQAAFADKIVPDPISNIENISKRDYKLKMTVQMGKPANVAEVREKVKKALDDKGFMEPLITTEPEGITSSARFDMFFKEDKESDIEALVRTELNLQSGPFPKVESISGMVARELQQNAVIAIILSWIGMILYLAVRFEFQFGVAAVIALVHDVLISLGAVVLFNMLAPKSWGISLDINLSTVASLLTIVGYSVNDTIVVFDRIRENTKAMKGDSMMKIIDLSVNQTLSRTLLTSLTVFLTVTILFIITARSGGGIAPFAFPMMIGTVVGTYSSVFIASALLKGARAKLEK
ncbi:MAG: protein translocase subunit SecD [Candidatus Brocadiia bacterium]